MDVLGLHGVDFAYPGGEKILKRLDFTLAEGDRVGIVGANGAGKSTLFKIAIGLLAPLSGAVTAMGKTLRGEKDFLAARRDVGFLFQDSDDQLFCPTVFEDVCFGPLNLGWDRAKVREKAHEVMDILGITNLSRRMIHQLSGGEKRLAALAGVLAMQPKAVLLDEPTTGLDDDHADRFEAALVRAVPTFAVVSHDREFLSRVCTAMYLLKDGGLIRLPG